MKKQSKFQQSDLKNGVKIITVQSDFSDVVSVQVFFDAGSLRETREINGIAHFLEHLMFKGSRKYKNSKIIADNIGARQNAFTGKSNVSYILSAKSKHVDTLFDLLSDRVFYPLLPSKDIEIERGVVLEEINRCIDNPSQRIWREVSNFIYGDNPWGSNGLGTAEKIKNMNRKDIVKFHHNLYVPSNSTVVVSGNVTHKKAVQLSKKYFQINNHREVPVLPLYDMDLTSESVKVVYQDIKQTHLVICSRTFGWHDKKRHAANVLSKILGGMFTSRLFKKLRDDLGLTYSTGSFLDHFSDIGMCGAYAAVANHKLEKAIYAILIELDKLMSKKVSKTELARAKESAISGRELNLNSPHRLAQSICTQGIAYGKVELPDEHESKIRRVTAEQVREVALEVFKRENLKLVVVGPWEDKKKFEKMLKIKN